MKRRSKAQAAAASAPPVPARYYRAADRAGAGLILWFPVVGVSGGIVLGAIYAFLAGLFQELESPGWMVVVTPLYAAGLALLALAVCRLGDVRGRRLRLAVSVIVGLMGLYIAWLIYLRMLSSAKIFDPLPTWHMSPVALGHAMRDLAAYRGGLSWVGWFAELVTVLGFIVYLMRSDAELPYCEKCGHWADELFQLTLGDQLYPSVAEQFGHGQVEALESLGERQPGATNYVVVRVNRCPCYSSRYASLERLNVDRGKGPSLRFRAWIPGKKELYFDPGSPRTTEPTAIVANLEIDEVTLAKLEAMRSKQVH